MFASFTFFSVCFLDSKSLTHISNGHWTSCFSSTRPLFQSSFFPSTILRHYHRSHCTWMVFISSPNVTAFNSFQYSRICVFCFRFFATGGKNEITQAFPEALWTCCIVVFLLLLLPPLPSVWTLAHLPLCCFFEYAGGKNRAGAQATDTKIPTETKINTVTKVPIIGKLFSFLFLLHHCQRDVDAWLLVSC